MAFRSTSQPPKRRGTLWYFTLLAREFPGWVGLNLLFFFSCLPLFTLGPALSALSHVLVRLAGDEPVPLVREYLSAFRTQFLRKMGWGLAFLGANLILGISLWFYTTVPSLLPLAGLTFAGFLCLWGVSLHLFPALSSPRQTDRPLQAAGISFLSTLGRSILSAAIALALLIFQIFLFPAVLPLTLSGGFVLPGLVLAFPCSCR